MHILPNCRHLHYFSVFQLRSCFFIRPLKYQGFIIFSRHFLTMNFQLIQTNGSFHNMQNLSKLTTFVYHSCSLGDDFTGHFQKLLFQEFCSFWYLFFSILKVFSFLLIFDTVFIGPHCSWALLGAVEACWAHNLL